MNCTDNYLPLGEHLSQMLRKSGKLVGLAITEVTGHTDNAQSCGLSHLTYDQLMARAIGTDACGKPALRVKFIATCTSNKTCTNKDVVKKVDFRQMFAFDATTKTVAWVLNKSV